MTTLYVDKKNLELRAGNGVLSFYEPEGRKGSVPISHIDRVVVHGNVKLSASVVATLTGAGVGVLFLSGRHNKYIATCVGLPHNDIQRKLGQLEAFRSQETRIDWSRKLVVAKITAQSKLLHKAMYIRSDKRKHLFNGSNQLMKIVDRINSTKTISLDCLRGFEGSAARIYFSAYRTLFAPSLEFTERNRRPPKDPVNACLSFAYTILHFEAVIRCHTAGLDPLLGLYHEPAYGRESLAADIIEPLRPHVDEWVWNLFRSRVLNAKSFTKDGQAVLMSKTARYQFYDNFRPLSNSLSRLMRLQTQSIAKGFVANETQISVYH